MKQENRFIRILLITVLVLMILSTGAEATEATDRAGEIPDLIIDTAGLTEEPLFIDWLQDGVPMQLIALKDTDGIARLAFNTCQSCNGSPWAWFEYIGKRLLECQNCRQKMPIDLVGTETAIGCAPIGIPEFTEKDDYIIVPAQVLEDAVPFFRNWRMTGE